MFRIIYNPDNGLSVIEYTILSWGSYFSVTPGATSPEVATGGKPKQTNLNLKNVLL